MLEPKHAKTKYGQRTFDYAAPRLWNALPVEIRSEEDVVKFKGMIKTLLFNGTDELKTKAFKYTWDQELVTAHVSRSVKALSSYALY